MSRCIPLFVVAYFCLAGCSYNAPIDVAPSYDVYSNYDNKLSGTYALYVDAEEMAEKVKVKGYNCSFHSYPVDAIDQFETSVVQTFGNLLESVQLVDSPLDREALKAQGYLAQIVVEVRDMDVDLVVHPGFWTSDMEADIEIAASIEATNYGGRVLGSTIEGDGDATVGAGGACEGGSEAIGDAMSEAMKETMERLGERLTNSRKMREIASTRPTV